MPDLSSLVAITIALVALLVVLHSIVILGLVRRVYDMQASLRPQQAAIQAAPEFAATDINGKPFSSRSLAGQARMLLFVSTTCRSCVTTLAETDA